MKGQLWFEGASRSLNWQAYGMARIRQKNSGDTSFKEKRAVQNCKKIKEELWTIL
jgi:hypothetical protein